MVVGNNDGVRVAVSTRLGASDGSDKVGVTDEGAFVKEGYIEGTVPEGRDGANVPAGLVEIYDGLVDGRTVTVVGADDDVGRSVGL